MIAVYKINIDYSKTKPYNGYRQNVIDNDMITRIFVNEDKI